MRMRILSAGVGGLSGGVFWYALVLPIFAHNGSRMSMRLSLYVLAVCILCFGVLARIIGEKSGLIPSQEDAEKHERPVSIFATEEKDGSQSERKKPDR
jgi:phosphotransferase system  glucose/maltose/N-acetylglucosamine-specific IIC component